MTKPGTLLFLTSGFGDNLLALPLALELEEKSNLTCISINGPQSEFFNRCLPGAKHIGYDGSIKALLSVWKAGLRNVAWVYPIGACGRKLRLLHLLALHRTAIAFTSLVARKAWQAEIGIDLCLLPDLSKRAWRNNLRLLQPLGLGTSRRWEDFTEILKARLTPEKRAMRRLVIHPGSARYAGRLERYKRWPLDRFKSVASTLLAQKLFDEVCWVLGPDDIELEEGLRELFRNESQHRLISHRVFNGSLLRMGAFLASANHMLTNDSGLAHLATLYDVPLTAVSSGIGEPSYTGQNGRHSHVLMEPTDCCGCCVGISREEAERFECGYDWACMNRITIDRVLDDICRRKDTLKVPNEVI